MMRSGDERAECEMRGGKVSLRRMHMVESFVMINNKNVLLF